VLYQLSYTHRNLNGYIIVLKIVLNFFLLRLEDIGPNKYLDFKSCFFLIKTALLCLKYITEPSNLLVGYLTLIIIDRQISPFLLNLNLKPLYSIRGGSTTLAEPFIKKPKPVLRLLKPLYR
jgi:hypothetical protein